MNIHEYQAKQLFRDVGLPVASGIMIEDVNNIANAISTIGGNKWVVKVQIHAGGRGKAGGVQLVDSVDEAEDFARKWLNQYMHTYQTDTRGQIVQRILIEPCTDITEELYLGMVVDRASQRIVAMASLEGGVEIEKVAQETPEKIVYIAFDTSGPKQQDAQDAAKRLGLTDQLEQEFIDIFMKLGNFFIEKDCALIEINPLVITQDQHLLCLDAKINFDSNALFRQPEIQAMHDASQEDKREVEASEWDLNYVALEGQVGCMVNGAGLAMGTMDAIDLAGGRPANFLDVGGTATDERVAQALRIILQDDNVRSILINIFGGIVRCDVIAAGILQALKIVKVEVPLIVRLEGTNADKGIAMLADSHLNIQAAPSLKEAVTQAVRAVK